MGERDELSGSVERLRAAAPGSGELLARIATHGPKGARLRLEGEIARGGMGAILRVRDEEIGRDLAMKVALARDRDAQPGSDVDERVLVRFLEEAQITGQLEHPGVVPVHELGVDDGGRVYFTMRLVQGRDLSAIFALVERGEEGWTRTRALNVLLRVCEAMAYAHSRGVVHRDLKPANVMVGSFGEVYVMDWGLARTGPTGHGAGDAVRTSRASERELAQIGPGTTLQGDVLGTPAYMPPEQARGRQDLLSARADVYALGAMLYHLLAGHAPYADAGKRSAREVLSDLLAGPPRPLRERCGDLPPELEAIAEKAMAREIEARYADMSELAEDLRAYLEGRVVRAHQTGAWIELRKWVARNRALSGAAAAAVLFLAAGLAASLWQRGAALENAALAAENAEEAREQGALAERRAVAEAAAARRAETVRDFLAGLLADANPLRTLERDVLVADVLADAADRLDDGAFADDPESEYVLRQTLGDAFQGVSRLAESELQYRRALELLEARAQVDPLERVSLQGDLADTLTSRGKSEEAERSARERLAALDGLAIGDHAQRVRALSQLSYARYIASRTREALEHLGQAIEVQERLTGPDSPELARLQGRQAFYLAEDGRYEEAIAVATRAIAVLERGSAQERFQATDVMRTRARVHQTLNQATAAIADLSRGLELRRELFGDDGLQVASFEADLGALLNMARELDAAEASVRHALEIRRRVLGDHVDTATSLASLGMLLSDRGDFEGSRALHEEALAMRLRVLGPDSAAIGDSKRNLGRLALVQGDPLRAETLLREALDNWESNLGAEHPDLALPRFLLGRALRAQGRFDEARGSIERALSAQERDLGIDNPTTHETRDEWFRLLLEMGEYAAVEAPLRASLARVAGRPGPLPAYLGALLGASLTGQGRYDEAEPLLLDGWRVVGADERLWKVNKLAVLDALVAFYEAVQDEEQAADYRSQAESLRQR